MTVRYILGGNNDAGVLCGCFFIPGTEELNWEVNETMTGCTPRKSACWNSGEANARDVLEEKLGEEMAMRRRGEHHLTIR